MTIKKEYLILAIVMVALALYLILGRQDRPGSDLPGLTELDSTSTNRMVIAQKGTALSLIKKDTRWFIQPNNYPVNPFKIKNMIKASTELTVTALVSESGNYERYGLSDTQRITVQIFQDKQMQREFNIGRAAPTVEHTFVQLADDANVYHAKGRLHTTFELTVDSLRDKTALSFDKAAIASLQIQRGDQYLKLTKTEMVEDAKNKEREASSSPATTTQWQSEDSTAASKSAVNALLGALSDLKCDAYMADDAKAGLADPVLTLTLKSDSKTHTLSLFAGEAKEAAQTPGTSSFNEFAFLLDKNRVETIEKQIDQLLSPTP